MTSMVLTHTLAQHMPRYMTQCVRVEALLYIAPLCHSSRLQALQHAGSISPQVFLLLQPLLGRVPGGGVGGHSHDQQWCSVCRAIARTNDSLSCAQTGFTALAYVMQYKPQSKGSVHSMHGSNTAYLDMDSSLNCGLPPPWKDPSEGIVGGSALASKGMRDAFSSSGSSLTAFLGLPPSVRCTPGRQS